VIIAILTLALAIASLEKNVNLKVVVEIVILSVMRNHQECGCAMNVESIIMEDV
jgi:hypothetical protein